MTNINPNNLPDYFLLGDKKTFGIGESNIGIPFTKFIFKGSDLIIILSKESAIDINIELLIEIIIYFTEYKKLCLI